MLKNGMKTIDMAQVSLLTALLCVIAPFQIPVGEVPITLATMAVVFISVLIGWQKGIVCCLLYLLIGACGVPVFSGLRGGLSVLAGPTGGYLWGYPVLALAGGLFYRHASSVFNNRSLIFAETILGFIIGTVLLYTLGTAWFIHLTKSSLSHAMAVCVYPFIPLDLVKIVLGVVLGDLLRSRLVKSGMI